MTVTPETSSAGPSLVGIEEPRRNDVLCGRGGRTNHHHGNAVFRRVVSLNRHLYHSVPRHEKAVVADSIVHAICHGAGDSALPGRFLEQNKKDGLWYEIGSRRTREKTLQALRDQKLYKPNENRSHVVEDDGDSSDCDKKRITSKRKTRRCSVSKKMNVVDVTKQEVLSDRSSAKLQSEVVKDGPVLSDVINVLPTNAITPGIQSHLLSGLSTSIETKITTPPSRIPQVPPKLTAKEFLTSPPQSLSPREPGAIEVPSVTTIPPTSPLRFVSLGTESDSFRNFPPVSTSSHGVSENGKNVVEEKIPYFLLKAGQLKQEEVACSSSSEDNGVASPLLIRSSSSPHASQRKMTIRGKIDGSSITDIYLAETLLCLRRGGTGIKTVVA